MFESFILGAVQGIAEWLPISSEAMIVLVKNNFFYDGTNIGEHIREAIFLHLGTLLAAVIYFWTRIKVLVSQLFHYQSQEVASKLYLNFILLTTFISGVVGVVLIKLVEQYEQLFINQTALNIAVACFLVITALLLYFSENKRENTRETPTNKDSIITGIFQGFAAIPGISRSGSTIAAMGLLGFNKVWALETSFILSIPLVLGANIVLNAGEFLTFNATHLVAILSACVFGYLTIAALLKIVEKVRFSYFVGFFAVIVMGVTIFLS